MELISFLRILRKFAVLLILTAVLSLSVAGAVSYLLIQNVYEASAVLFVSPGSGGTSSAVYSDYLITSQLVESYRVLCKTERVLSQVAEQTGLGLSTKALSDKITVASEGDTEIIRISVRDGDPQTASLIANSVAEVFVSEVPKIIRLHNVQIIDAAEPSELPVGPNRPVIVAVTFILSMVGACALAMLIEYADVTVRRPEQVENRLEAPVLGAVPHMNRGAGLLS